MEVINAYDFLDAVIKVYERRGLNVAANVAKFFQLWNSGNLDDKTGYFLRWLDKRGNQYKEDIQRYLMLV